MTKIFPPDPQGPVQRMQAPASRTSGIPADFRAQDLERQEQDHHNHDHDSEQSPVEPRLRDLPFQITNLPRILLLGPIRLYQATLSRSLPADTCRFYPTCSHYGYQAIYKYGALKGGWMAFWRVLRCNPFNPGGFDPVP